MNATVFRQVGLFLMCSCVAVGVAQASESTKDEAPITKAVAKEMLYGTPGVAGFKWASFYSADKRGDSDSFQGGAESSSLSTRKVSRIADGRQSFKWGEAPVVDASAYKWGIRSSGHQAAYKWGIRSSGDQAAYKWGIRSSKDQAAYKWGIRSSKDQAAYKWGIRSSKDQAAYKWGIRSSKDQAAYKWGIRSSKIRQLTSGAFALPRIRLPTSGAFAQPEIRQLTSGAFALPRIRLPTSGAFAKDPPELSTRLARGTLVSRAFGFRYAACMLPPQPPQCFEACTSH
jgi:hypothetical protein